MNIRRDPAHFDASSRWTPAAFLEWAHAREGRYELKNGMIVDMTGVSRAHAELAASFVHALMLRLSRAEWRVTTADFAVEIGEDVRYPDVVVERANSDRARLSTRTPVLLVEIMSPNSEAVDLGDKVREYLGLGSLLAYVVASQTDPLLRVWEREADGTFPAEPRVIAGRSAGLAVAGLGVNIPLADLYFDRFA